MKDKFLTIDIGNTEIKVGFYDGSKQLLFERFATQSDIVSNLEKAIKLFDQPLNGAIISSVVPSKTESIADLLKKHIKELYYVDADFPYLNAYVAEDKKAEVGSDLLVLADYAYSLNKEATMVLSCGTCNVLLYVDEKGQLKYCMIAPGLLSQLKALSNDAALLPTFTLAKIDDPLTDDTIKALNIGIVDGTIGALNHLIKTMKAALKKADIKLLAAGGMGKVLTPYIEGIDLYLPDMVTEGLKNLYLRSKEGK